MSTVSPVEFKRSAVSPVECIKGGWNLIKGQYWLILGMIFVGLMIGAAVPFGILMGPMMCGLFLTFFKMRRREPVEFGTLFKGFEYFSQSILATLIHVIPITMLIIGAYILFYVFFLFAMITQANQEPNPTAFLVVIILYALFWLAVIALIMFLSIGFMFVYPLIVDRKLQGFDAVRMSFKAAFANFWGLLGLVFLNFLLGIAGMLMCIIGVYFVMPITYAGMAVAYEQIFGLSQAAAPPDTPPPPPVFT